MARASVRSIGVYLAVAAAVPIAALGWLALRTLEQEREAARQRAHERLEIAGGRAALGLERELQSIEQRLAAGTAAGVRLDARGVVPQGAGARVLYQPFDAPALPAIDLAAGEVEEFQHGDLQAAGVAYAEAARTADPRRRAAALAALARVRKKAGDRAAARAGYDQLETLGQADIAGQPAALAAMQARARLFDEAGDVRARDAESRALADALAAGRWPLDRATFEMYRGLLARWQAPVPRAADVAMTEAAAQLWHAWRRGELAGQGRRLWPVDGVYVLALWTATTDAALVHLEPADALAARADAQAAEHHVAIALATPEGRPVVGTAAAGGVSLMPMTTRLPFVVTATASPADTADDARTRPTAATGALVVAMVLIAAAAYGLFRAMRRELRLAEQQADFVAAVSHEFRTPLTSMRHLTDVLASRRDLPEERRGEYYALLTRETSRLHRLVEGLLSFGRIEAGRYAWQIEPIDPGVLVADVADEFRREPAAAAHAVTCDIAPGLPTILADREALARVLWNLLENAAKYSEAGAAISIAASPEADAVALAVTDQGRGIAGADRDRIFQRFVRGDDVRRDGIGGVGLGLALARRIVDAHGGAIRVESAPGRGSTFTVLLPVTGHS
jgi:two-component system phosphate regulon sensor histidine kinase PhoR